MHVSFIVPAAFSTICDASIYDRRMAECLSAAGHEVQVIELAGRFADPDRVAIDAVHTAWAELRSDSVPLIDGRALPGFTGLAAALAPRRATILIHHPSSLDTGATDEVRQGLHAREASLFQAAPRQVVTSEQTADQLVSSFAVQRDRITVIAPGIGEPVRSHGSRSGSSSSASDCSILSVGPLIPRRGHDVLLRALSRLFDLDWHLTIVGAVDQDPVHAQGLLALAEELHIVQHVHFAGEVSAEAMEMLWQNADLFASASWFEGYGMALAEALRRGLPVAATAVGAAPTLVGSEAGVLCAPGDAEQLSKAMRRLIFDQNLRRTMAEAAWQCARAMPSWHDQAIRLAAVLAG